MPHLGEILDPPLLVQYVIVCSATYLNMKTYLPHPTDRSMLFGVASKSNLSFHQYLR